MSVWTDVHGTVMFSKESKCSLKKLILSEFGDEVVIAPIEYSGVNNFRAEVKFKFCLDGFTAANMMKNMVAKVLAFDPKASIDLTAEIRFLG